MSGKTPTTIGTGYDHKSYVDVLKDFNAAPARFKELTEAEKQKDIAVQDYSFNRFWGMYIDRRNMLRQSNDFIIERGPTFLFNAATNLGRVAFNFRNPQAMLVGGIQLFVSTCNEIRKLIRDSDRTREDTTMLQTVMWEHVNDKLLGLLTKRAVRDDGTIYELDQARDRLIGAVNDPYVMKRHPDPKSDRQPDPETRKKLARLLDCQIDEETGKIVKNEDCKDINPNGYRYKIGDTFSPTPLRWDPPETKEPESKASAPPTPPAPAMVR